MRRHSTLFALLGLMVLFELLGRLVGADVREALATGGIGDALSAAWEALASTDMVFLSPRNLTNLMLQVSINGILAIGMTLIILTGGIDLSVGSVVALTGIVLGLADKAYGTGGLAAPLATTIAAGVVVGAVNGALIARFKIPPFVITLGMLVIARGLALIFSNSSAISPLSEGIRTLGSGFAGGPVAIVLFVAGLAFLAYRQRLKEVGSGVSLLLYAVLGGLMTYVMMVDRGVPVPILVLAGLAALGILLQSQTTFGRSVYAIGGNEHAAVLAGIPVPRVKLLVYTLMGGLAAVSGVVLAGRLNSATPTEGSLMELDAIASVVIGGTSLRGGIGRIQGSLIGAFIIGTLNNGMDMLEISSNWQMVTKGLIIVLAVYSDARLKNKG